MLLVKTARDSIFGAFTDISWDKSSQDKIADGNSFLFLVQDEEIVKFEHLKNGSAEIYSNGIVGPMFGGSGGCRDLSIYDKCNENDSSYAELGKGYRIVDNIKCLDKGHVNFTVAEMEIYKIE